MKCFVFKVVSQCLTWCLHGFTSKSYSVFVRLLIYVAWFLYDRLQVLFSNAIRPSNKVINFRYLPLAYGLRTVTNKKTIQHRNNIQLKRLKRRYVNFDSTTQILIFCSLEQPPWCNRLLARKSEYEQGLALWQLSNLDAAFTCTVHLFSILIYWHSILCKESGYFWTHRSKSAISQIKFKENELW